MNLTDPRYRKWLVAFLTSVLIIATLVGDLALNNRLTLIAAAVVSVLGAWGVRQIPNKQGSP